MLTAAHGAAIDVHGDVAHITTPVGASVNAFSDDTASHIDIRDGNIIIIAITTHVTVGTAKDFFVYRASKNIHIGLARDITIVTTAIHVAQDVCIVGHNHFGIQHACRLVGIATTCAKYVASISAVQY